MKSKIALGGFTLEFANSWLEKYEIKKPDYDYIDREYIGMKDAQFAPARYVRDGDWWKSRKKSHGLFGKKTARIMFVGDITCFDKQFEEAQQGKDYDFSYEFEKVRPVFAEADLVVGNLETSVFPNAPYRTEKFVSEQNFHCNAPIEFLDAVRKAGIDVLTNANNHDLDTGAVGIGETIDAVERMGFIQTGTFKSEKKRYELIDVYGFKIAVVAFATEHNNKSCNLTPEGNDFLLNNYSYDKAKKIFDEARADGAELIFTCIHWGKENKVVQNREQTRIAEELAELGCNCIIGSHPHVLQPFTMLNAKGQIVPTFYSMGNFISHNIDNQNPRSVIACVDLERQGNIITMSCTYIPVFTSKTVGEKKYVVVPMVKKPADKKNKKRVQQITAIVGNEIEINETVKFAECAEKHELKLPSLKDIEPDIIGAKEFPVEYDDKKFTYSIYLDHALITGISSQASAASCTVPAKILDLPVMKAQSGAFAGCTTVKKINFKKNITSIPEKLCCGCTALEGFQLSESTTDIGAEAFAGCSALTAAVMRSGVKKIGSRAFADCSGLVNVKLPVNVCEIADDAFTGCGKAVFYCEEGSYAEQYAKAHGFAVVNMKLY